MQVHSGHKVPLRVKVDAPPTWYPMFHHLGENISILENVKAQEARTKRLSDPQQTTCPVDQKLRMNKVKEHLVAPLHLLAGSTKPWIKFAFMVSVLPGLALHLETSDICSPDSAGLLSSQWRDLLNNHGDDVRSTGNIGRTKVYCRKLGRADLIRLLDGKAESSVDVSSQQQPLQSIAGNPTIAVYDDWSDEDDDEQVDFETPFGRKWDARYFVDGLVPALEVDRWLYEPKGWRMKAKGQMRPQKDYLWFTPGDRSMGGGYGGEEFEDDRVLEWRQWLPGTNNSHGNFRELAANSDLWVCYEKGYILMFPRFPDPAGSGAVGARVLQRSRFYYLGNEGLGGRRQKEWRNSSKAGQAEAGLVLWHRHEPNSSIPLPTYPIGEVGMFCKSKAFDLPLHFAQHIFPMNVLQSPQQSSSTQSLRDKHPIPISLSISRLLDLRKGHPLYFDGLTLPPYDPPQQVQAYDWPPEYARIRIGYLAARMTWCTELLTTDMTYRTLFPHIWQSP
ncbi:hypothetical protein BKA62DRAFT_777325 [Auriculariales sp. MPI-PUGE-AT-0066]|nr:hypothetical protein BKA62DRAFT_777325 [Auriculariales sp. MPI-PUGE-AT-0066]